MFDLTQIPVMVASIALIGVFVTQLVTLIISRKNLEVSLSNASLGFNSVVLSKNRQDWINTLREELSYFVSLVHHAHDTMVVFQSPQARAAESADSTRTELYRRSAKIQLLLNPTEDDHKNLTILLDNAVEALKGGDSSYRKEVEKIIKISQVILKAEWTRVKAGK